MPFEIFPGAVIIRLEHDGTQIGTYDDTDPDGPFPTFECFRIHYENQTGDTYEIEVEPENEPPRNFSVAPFEVGDNGNIAPPQRFPTHPMTIKRTINRS